jgi:ATP:corrinoid adenosyltransferase
MGTPTAKAFEGVAFVYHGSASGISTTAIGMWEEAIRLQCHIWAFP